jgi:hypothetical protein
MAQWVACTGPTGALRPYAVEAETEPSSSPAKENLSPTFIFN